MPEKAIWNDVPPAENLECKVVYIDQYICNFAATWDANHFDLKQGIPIPACDINTAKRLAERSWISLGPEL